jgi:hypothetical protein
MKKTIRHHRASSLTLFSVLLVASATACSAPTEPSAPAAPAISAELLATSSRGFVRAITINPTMVPNTDQKNFPVLVAGTFDGTNETPDLRTIANGGKVWNANGYDVGFYAKSDCSGKLAWETEKYDAATGQVAYWVKVATVSHTTNTVFYLCYGSSSITSNQAAPTSVWDGNFLAVWHLADKGGLDLTNSNGSNYVLTNSGPVASDQGKIGGGTNKFADATYYLDNAKIAIGANKPVTISMWKKLLAADDYEFNPEAEGNHITFGMGAEHSSLNSMTLWAPYFGTAYWYYSDGGPQTSFFPYYDRWVYITCVYNPSASRLKALYLDGSLATSSTNGTTTTATVTGFRLGQARDGHGQDASQFDEVRVSNIVRTADWIKTEFNNQNDPASFYAFGTEKAR